MTSRAELRANLPAPDLARWTTKQKAAVVVAVIGRAITLRAACERYALSSEEFHSWRRSLERGGLRALRATRIQDFPRHERTAGQKGKAHLGGDDLSRARRGPGRGAGQQARALDERARARRGRAVDRRDEDRADHLVRHR